MIVHEVGFSLKGDVGKQITLDLISSCTENSEKITVNYKENICCDNHQNVFVKDIEKCFKFTLDKRVVLQNFFYSTLQI